MCVIIYIPQNERISKEELEDAWRVNPDGAGLAYPDGGAVRFRRGYMNRDYYIKRVLELQEQHNGGLLLHLRISTGAGVTPQGTHPYKSGNVLKMQGRTTAPVVCMNGIITGQQLHKKDGQLLNDTASYIWDHSSKLVCSLDLGSTFQRL